MRDDTTLLITSVRTGSTEIFAVNPMTGDARNLTRNPESEERYPCWSPDGREIAFASNRDGAHNLYVMNADGTGLRQLTHEQAPSLVYFPSWQGDGRRIWFGCNRGQPLICSIGSDGTDFRVTGSGHDPQISPDGATVAFVQRLANGYVVFTADADGCNERQLTSHENRIGAVTPTWSPDGRRLLYVDQAGDALEIFCVEKDGGNLRQLTALGRIATSPAWSPDMEWITFRLTDEAFWMDPARMKQVYEQKPADKRPVWMARADGSEARVIEPLRYQCAMDGSRAVWKPF